MTSADLLTAIESCHRRGHYSKLWQRRRLTPIEMVRRGVIAGLTVASAEDFGEHAGEEVITLCSERGLDMEGSGLYDCGLNHAAIADIVTTAIRKPDDRHCKAVGAVNGWETSALMEPGGTRLRRFLPVSSWNADRQRYEMRSWYCLGEVAQFGIPMQLIVAVIGGMSGNRRHGYWSKALLHPQRSSVRFRRRSRKTIEGFKETWMPIFREEHAEIDRRVWLQGMMEDDVLQESLFIVDIPVPCELDRQRVKDMAARQLDRLGGALPDKQLSTCDNPLSPCPFRSCCWGETEAPPSEAMGFEKVGLR